MDSMDSMESLWIYQLGIPLITPEPYIQPWMGQYKNHFIQNKREKNKKEDNAMHLENFKFKLCKNAKCKCNRTPDPSKHLQGSNA